MLKVYRTYLSVNPELGHRIDNAQKSLNALRLLANHRLVNIKLDVVLIKVSLQLLAVDIEDVLVHDSQATAPFTVAVCQLWLGWVENIVDEGEIVLDLLVAFDVETLGRLGDGGFHVGHFGLMGKVIVEEEEEEEEV